MGTTTSTFHHHEHGECLYWIHSIPTEVRALTSHHPPTGTWHGHGHITRSGQGHGSDQATPPRCHGCPGPSTCGQDQTGTLCQCSPHPRRCLKRRGPGNAVYQESSCRIQGWRERERTT